MGIIDGMHLGTMRVYTVNPDSGEHNTAYKGNEFSGNAIIFTEDVGVSINGTEGVKAVARDVIYVSDNYYYNFSKETLIAQAIMQVPNLGVSQSETSLVDVALTKDTESVSIVTMTLATAMGEIPAGRGTMEVSFTVENTSNKDTDMIVRVYDDGDIGGEETVAVGKTSTLNYFKSLNILKTISAESVLTVTVELGEAGNVLAPCDITVRRET